ncbi:hypothetical protein [Saccharibacillus endophyticus]|uniref:Uncharacterized protein n=1 Tax=Saccharibacillus endophyticus TaxID=2060666 RepID=A0ABQ1ZJA2_9BACL|nr:hypothetical protein [Saccharibacillus endophyticus]GGH68086.1 hypothetical protein GCM10007362_01740 [Saccharibacillus endophyticus]
MIANKRHIRIGAEEWMEGLEDAQVDVVVTFPNSTKWISNFYTIKCIESMRKDYLMNGHCLKGAYWCASSPIIIVDRISRDRIEQVIDELIETGGFRDLFDYFGAVQEEDIIRHEYPENFFDQSSKLDPSYVTSHASQLAQMLDQSSEEVRETVLKGILGYLKEAKDFG